MRVRPEDATETAWRGEGGKEEDTALDGAEEARAVMDFLEEP